MTAAEACFADRVRQLSLASVIVAGDSNSPVRAADLG
jgi:hypothetical protein